MSNRVEHQKLNQVAAELPPGWVFGVQLGLRQTQALIKTKNIRRRKVPPAILLLCRKHYYFVVKLLQSSNITSATFLLLIFLSWSVPVSAEGRVEHQKLNQVGAARPPPGWVFGVQLDYSCHKKTRRGPVRAALVHIFKPKKWKVSFGITSHPFIPSHP